MIDKMEFGRTGHQSTRVIFGAAALSAMKQEKADALLATLLSHGINHIDVAASYGEAELRVGPWLAKDRDRFFVATKTHDRTAGGAYEMLCKSLERLQTDRIDLIQMHNLVDREGWETALGSGGALEGLIRARDEGLVRFIGVTGHGVSVAARHLESLERFPFDSVLLPYNYPMMQIAEYAGPFEELLAVCAERGVAVQTIKSVARRRWQGTPERRFSWYEPLRDPDAIRASVRWVLARPGVFLNTSSDGTILGATLEAAADDDASTPAADEMQAHVDRHEMTPLFVPGQDAI